MYKLKFKFVLSLCFVWGFFKFLSSGVVSFATNKRMFKFGQELGTNYHKIMFKFNLNSSLFQVFFYQIFKFHSIMVTSLTKYIEEKLGIILCVHVLYQFHVIKFKYSIQVHSFQYSNFFFLISTFRSILFIFFFILHQMTNFQQQMISQTFMWCKITFPDWINIILFRNLFLSYTNINYNSFLSFEGLLLFNSLDVGTLISQFNLFKHEIFIYIVFGECVTVKNSDNDLELYLKLIECNFRSSSYFLFA